MTKKINGVIIKSIVGNSLTFLFVGISFGETFNLD